MTLQHAITSLAVVATLLSAFIGAMVAYDLKDKGPYPEKAIEADYGWPSDLLTDLSNNKAGLTVSIKKGESEISNLRIIHTLVQNTGKSPIVPSDYFEPLSLRTADPWHIIAVASVETGSAVRNSKVGHMVPLEWSRKSDNEFVSKPALLNPGDMVPATVYLTGPERPAEADEGTPVQWAARIINLREISEPPKVTFRAEASLLNVNVWGWGIPFLLASFALYEGLYLLGLYRLGAFNDPGYGSFLLILASSLISLSAAEAGTTYIFGTSPFFQGVNHWMNAPPLILNVVLLGMLVVKSFRVKRSLPAQASTPP
jgi:hypothetical protein